MHEASLAEFQMVEICSAVVTVTAITVILVCGVLIAKRLLK